MAVCFGCGLDWGNVPDQVVALTAVISAWLVVNQLTGLRADRDRADQTAIRQLDQFRAEAQTSRANLLLRIDEQFEGGGVFRSRARWLELRAEFRRAYAALASPAGTREDYVEAKMIEKLNALWDRMQSQAQGGASFPADVRDYNLVVRLPNWIETIGMLARDGLLPVGDLLKLYGSVIRTTMAVVAGHVAHRRLDSSASPTVFENALWLQAQATPSP